MMGAHTPWDVTHLQVWCRSLVCAHVSKDWTESFSTSAHVINVRRQQQGRGVWDQYIGGLKFLFKSYIMGWPNSFPSSSHQLWVGTKCCRKGLLQHSPVSSRHPENASLTLRACRKSTKLCLLSMREKTGFGLQVVDRTKDEELLAFFFFAFFLLVPANCYCKNEVIWSWTLRNARILLPTSFFPK